jgi:hypothetical protein
MEGFEEVASNKASGKPCLLHYTDFMDQAGAFLDGLSKHPVHHGYRKR